MLSSNRGTDSRRAFCGGRRPRRLRRRSARPQSHSVFESLEPRIVLSTTAPPGIVGTVFSDLNGDGLPNADETLSGVTVQLQYWFRVPGGGSHLSNSLTATFCP